MYQRALILLVSSLAACSSGLGGGGPVSAMVGTSGGAVATSDGSKVMIPGGALSSDTVITLVPADNPAVPTTATTVGAAYNFGPEGTTFTKPVLITLAFVPEKLPVGMSATDVVIYTAPTGSTEYTALATTPVDDTHVAASSTHFSVFVPAVDAKPSCSATCKPLSGSCECTATCQGKKYSLLCYDGEGCVCKTDGSETKTLPIGLRCSDSAGLKSTYTTSCSYPGKFL